MSYEIGQIVRHTPQRGIQGNLLPEPQWFALTVPPGKEATSRGLLERHGIHAQYPTREKRRIRLGKAVINKLPLVTRVVYARFERAPQWDILKERRYINGVYGGSVPYVVPYAIIRHIMGMPTVEAEIRAARAEMMRLTAGDRAQITAGPFAGFVVDVRRVERGRAWFETISGQRDGFTVKGEVALTALEKQEAD